MRILVLGGYGLIGEMVVRRLVAEGNAVTGLGRVIASAAHAIPEARWVAADMANLTASGAWRDILAGHDVVVNCAGALQDGPRDDLVRLQDQAVAALAAACGDAGIKRLVHVSAPGVSATASTAFMRTKAAGDAHVKAGVVPWIILRPGLVIAPAAYGGTALLRALASLPLVIPLLDGTQRLQTVPVGVVADAVVMACDGRLPSGTDVDLVADAAVTLAEAVGAFRAWQGRGPVRMVMVPPWLGRLAFRGGDLLGRLGWRTPVRTTARLALEHGVIGDPARWRQASGRSVPSLAATLALMPATVQERWYGRMWLMKPLVIATLACFWLASGTVALLGLDGAIAVLTRRGVGTGLATAAVVAGIFIDIALALAVVVRRTMPGAALGMIATSLGYLAGATLLAADLWGDPLGPLVKVLPGITLALVALAIADER